MNSGIGFGDRGSLGFVPQPATSGALPMLVASSCVAAIFFADAILHWDIGLEGLYIVVILFAAPFLRQKVLVLAAIGCAWLTVTGLLLNHDPVLSVTKEGHRFVAVVAIGITALLVGRNKPRDATGRIGAWFGTNTDAENRPWPAQDDVRAAVDAIPAHVWTLHADGSPDYFNRHRLDYTGPEVDFLAIIHPDDRPAHDDRWAHALATGSPIQLEVRLRRFDGNYRWFLFRAEPQRDTNGRIVKWFGTNTDIDDLRRTEQALRRSETYLADAQRLSKTGSFGWRADGRHAFWSDETYRIFGYESSVEPSMERMISRIHSADIDDFRLALDRLQREASDISLELRLRADDDTVKHLRILARPMTRTRGEAEFIGAVIDITGAKRAEEALQRAQGELAHVTRVATLGELTASIAHEVSQPLTGIVTNGEACLRWLRRDKPDLLEAECAVERVVGDGRRAGDVVRRLRALTRKEEPIRLPLDLNQVVEEALPLVRHEFSRHRIALELKFMGNLPLVLGDRVQLQQVVINLIVNGIQAMAEVTGRPNVLTISSLVTEAEVTEVVLAVQDSGLGVKLDIRNRLFDAFFTTRADGMGMGLSICRSIVEAHGGRIWIAANPVEGTAFLIALPANHGALG